MDTLPMPDFGEYFAAIHGTDLHEKANLVAESSRGCWWGAKSHCTFCGLNGTTMSFRRKTPARFAQQLRTLVRRHGDRYFMMADNILDMSYITTLFPELIAEGDDIRMFYETKSNLRKEQLELMAAGGIWKIQPGIESLSTPILHLMRKGTTRLQNVQLLKWCEEVNIKPVWHLLYGFPAEPEDEYRSMAALMPSLVHLPPPGASGPIQLQRFSPYWRDPGGHGVRNLRHHWAFDFAYAALPPEERSRLAYFFEFDYGDGRVPSRYVDDVVEQVAHWQAASARRATLEAHASDGNDYVIDSRLDTEGRRWQLTSGMRRVLDVLDAVRSRDAALVALNSDSAGCESLSHTDLERLLQVALERGWVIEEDGRFLSLVLDRSEIGRVRARRVSLQLQRLGLPSLV
jgi:ribosomal peptide maturation radical SAM protein 1